MVFCYGIVPCVYSFVIELLPNKQTKFTKIIGTLCTIPILICGGLLAILCLVFKLLLYVYLKLRHKEDFGSFLNIDTLMERMKLTITYVYILEQDGSYEDSLINIEKACQSLYKSNYKFSSTVRKCCGLYYFLKNQVNVEDIISVLDEHCSTKNELLNYLESNHFNDFSSKIKLWDVTIFKKPITWCSSNRMYYPVVIRFNHCIGDGVCLSAFQNKYFLSDVAQKRFENAMVKSKRSEDVLRRSNCLRMGLIVRKMTSNYLRLPNDDVERLALFVENEPKYLELIRMLSRKLQCTFTDVVLSVCAASILDYLKLENASPNEIFIGNTCREISEDVTKVCKAEVLRNDQSIDFFKIACLNEKDLQEKIESWSGILKKGRRMGTFQNFFILRKIATYAPSVAIKFLFTSGLKKICVGLTNIPGPDFGNIGNNVIKDSFVFVNNFSGIKFIMILHSYGGRLQASLVSDKRVPITRKGLQSILDGTFNKIDELSKIYKP